MEECSVLYVDDDPDNLVVFRSNFEDEFKVFTSRSGEEALRLLEREKVAVLLTDQRMPRMTGVQLCELVRKLYPNVRRILITAYADQTTAIEAINRGGVHAFQRKPWRHDELASLLQQQIEPVRLQRTVSALRLALAQRNRQSGLSSTQRQILHDLGGGLQRLRLNSALLERAANDDTPESRARLPELTRRILRSLDHVASLHAQLGALGTRHQQLHPQRLSMCELLEAVRELSGVDFTRVARFQVQCPPSLTVFADRVAVTRILMNLVSNAVEAIESAGIPDGEITLQASACGEDTIWIDVTDTGPGIAPEDRDRLFEAPFTTRKDAGGSGLGLSAARDLALHSRGNLQLNPPGPRIGASFRLVLPAHPAAAELGGGEERSSLP